MTSLTLKLAPSSRSKLLGSSTEEVLAFLHAGQSQLLLHHWNKIRGPVASWVWRCFRKVSQLSTLVRFLLWFLRPPSRSIGRSSMIITRPPRHAPWEAMASTAEGWKVEWHLWFELRSHSGLHPLNFEKNGQRNFGVWRTYKEIALGKPHGDASIAANQPGQLLPRSSCSSRSSSPTILGARVRVRPAKSKERDSERNSLSRHGRPIFLRKVLIKH